MKRKISFEHGKLLGLLKEKGISQAQLAEMIGITKVSLCSKLSGKRPFYDCEIISIQEKLDIDLQSLYSYFFFYDKKLYPYR